MEYEYGEAKIQHGKSFPVKFSKDMGYDDVKERALKKWEDYDSTFSRDRGYVITYQDGQLPKRYLAAQTNSRLENTKKGLAKAIVEYTCTFALQRRKRRRVIQCR